MNHENIYIAETAIDNAQNSISILKAIIVEQQKRINELENSVDSLQVYDGDALTVELSVEEHKKLLDIQEKYNNLKRIIESASFIEKPVVHQTPNNWELLVRNPQLYKRLQEENRI